MRAAAVILVLLSGGWSTIASLECALVLGPDATMARAAGDAAAHHGQRHHADGHADTGDHGPADAGPPPPAAGPAHHPDASCPLVGVCASAALVATPLPDVRPALAADAYPRTAFRSTTTLLPTREPPPPRRRV